MTTRKPTAPQDPEVKFHLAVESIRADLAASRDQLRAIQGLLDTLTRHTSAISDRLETLEANSNSPLTVYKDAQKTSEERERLRRERTDKVLLEVWNKGGSWFMLAVFFLLAAIAAKALGIPLPLAPLGQPHEP